MKSGVRALGIAESYREEHSILGGVVTRADRAVDGFVFGQCRVGGLDATETVVSMVAALDREDVQYLLLAGIAPAWYNVLDLHAIHEATGIPTLSVSFEESQGLEAPLREAFDGEALDRRLERYRAQPPRERVTLDGEPRFVRSVGLTEPPERVVSAFTPAGGRPEPLRVARLAARGVDRFRRESGR
ncbi:MAG: DUF99 family protein [Halodesulfurarchaeum sp.]